MSTEHTGHDNEEYLLQEVVESLTALARSVMVPSDIKVQDFRSFKQRPSRYLASSLCKSSADVSIADVSIADVSIADVSIADVSIADVSVNRYSWY